MRIKQYLVFAVSIFLMVGCSMDRDPVQSTVDESIWIYSAASETEPQELEYLEWVYRNYLVPELVPEGEGVCRSHMYVEVQMDDAIRQALNENEGVSKAIKEEVTDNNFHGFSLVEGSGEYRLRYLSAWVDMKVNACSVLPSDDLEQGYMGGDPFWDKFEVVAKTCASTDALLNKYTAYKERDRDDVWTSTVQSYLLVSGYVGGRRCVYIVPIPQYESEFGETISGIEVNAGKIMRYAADHFGMTFDEAVYDRYLDAGGEE